MLLAVSQVFATSLLAGLCAGWLMHRADFCTVAALRDSFLFRDTGMLRAQALLVALSVVFFELLRLTGLQAYSAVPFYGLPSLSNLVGGVLFGFGMVLAGGCVVGVLYRLGSGSRLALAALFGLVCGSALYAEIHPWWHSLAVASRLSEQATLPLLTGIPMPWWSLAMALLAFCLWRDFSHRHATRLKPSVRGYVALHHAALGLSLCGVACLVLVGMPMGVTTTYAKIAAVVERQLLPEHAAALEFFAVQPFDYTPPYSELSLAGGAGWQLDALALIQYPLIFGILAGAALSSWRLKEFRARFRPPRLQLFVTFGGGLTMGLASRLTPGCNVWHLWGGLPHLALSSVLFCLGLVPGAWLGARLIRQIIFRSQQEIMS